MSFCCYLVRIDPDAMPSSPRDNPPVMIGHGTICEMPVRAHAVAFAIGYNEGSIKDRSGMWMIVLDSVAPPCGTKMYSDGQGNISFTLERKDENVGQTK